jgi:hypothetical protein
MDDPDELEQAVEMAADAAGTADEVDDAEHASSHPAVDEVLRSLERLGDLPVDEHVAAFEQAHDDLRRALAEARERGE